jgi:hypothetical protein
MWDYVFSPHAMMVDAAAGLVAFVLFRLLRPGQPPSKIGFAAVALIATLINHHYQGGSPARAMPTGYVGGMVQACARQESREACVCALDALKERVGEAGVMKLAVRTEANQELPQEVLDAVAGCRG